MMLIMQKDHEELILMVLLHQCYAIFLLLSALKEQDCIKSKKYYNLMRRRQLRFLQFIHETVTKIQVQEKPFLKFNSLGTQW